jgi:Protein of unknown function (DUF4236)
MGLRFRRSITLAPGIRMNFGLRGLSLSMGSRGASVNIGPRGTYANVGIPGTGLSTRSRIGGGHSGRTSRSQNLNGLNVAFRLQDDGTVSIVAENGSALPPRAIKMAREQSGERLRTWLEEKCEHWNKDIDELLGIHLRTPRPDRIPLDAEREEYPRQRPTEPVPRRLHVLARIFKSWGRRIELRNSQAVQQHAKDLATWEVGRVEHERLETERLRLFEADASPEPSRAHEYLSGILGRVEWPRETSASIEVNEAVTGALIDVDLPEIEDMPDKIATVAARGLKINIKDRPSAQRRREYMTHVHGVVFRIVGEVFAALPRIQRVVASGYSQRDNPETGHVSDEYLLSIRASRAEWSTLNFSNLAALDPVSCLGKFEIRRSLSATGVFKPIEPFSMLETGA